MQDFAGASSIALALLALIAVGMFAPTWAREYNERRTQRNAVRLQQIIRSLAQTAQVPEVVEVEATARGVRVQQRELRRARRIEAATVREQARAEARLRELEAERKLAESRAQAQEREAAEAEMADAIARREAAARARAAAARAARREAQARCEGATAAERWADGVSGAERAIERKLTGQVPAGTKASRAATRRRRGRVTATSAATGGLILAVIGVIVLKIALLLAGIVITGCAVWMLVRINSVWRAQQVTEPAEITEVVAEPETAPTAVSPGYDMVFFDLDTSEAVAPKPVNSWTPVPLPKPLYLSRAAASDAPDTDPDGPGSGVRDQMDVDLAKLLRDEVARSTQALRDAHRDVATLPSNAQRIQPITVHDENAWSNVGDVDALLASAGADDFADLDAVLRRRRVS